MRDGLATPAPRSPANGIGQHPTEFGIATGQHRIPHHERVAWACQTY